MGRGRGKGKRFSMTNHGDGGSGEDEKIPVQKRRGRPQKPLKDEETDGENYNITEEEEIKNTENGVVSDKELLKSFVVAENGKKRKAKPDLLKVENGLGNNSISFRHIGSRRKSKPHRAAEVGLGCIQ